MPARNSADAECIGEHETLAQAARRMRDLNVGALPVCGENDRPNGIITGRGIAADALVQLLEEMLPWPAPAGGRMTATGHGAWCSMA